MALAAAPAGSCGAMSSAPVLTDPAPFCCTLRPPALRRALMRLNAHLRWPLLMLLLSRALTHATDQGVPAYQRAITHVG